MEGFGAIPVFVAVVEHGGFSPAARALGISKSAVSKRINQLEDQLGVRLLHRTTRKMSLTEAGQRYFVHASASLAAAAQAEDAVTELQGRPRGQLRINAPMSFGRLHVAPLIAGFLNRYPELRLELVMDDRKIDLVAEGFDVAIRVGDLPDSTLVARKLAPCRHVLCASPDYVQQKGAPARPEQLAEHNCVLYSYSSDAAQWTLLRDGQQQSVSVAGNYRANNSEALLEAIRNGIGIGRLPTFVAGPDISTGKLVPLLETWRMRELTIYAVFPEREYLPAKVRVFLEFAADAFGGDEPTWDSI